MKKQKYASRSQTCVHLSSTSLWHWKSHFDQSSNLCRHYKRASINQKSSFETHAEALPWKIVLKLDGEKLPYKSIDSVECDDPAEAANYPVEFLNELRHRECHYLVSISRLEQCSFYCVTLTRRRVSATVHGCLSRHCSATILMLPH